MSLATYIQKQSGNPGENRALPLQATLSVSMQYAGLLV